MISKNEENLSHENSKVQVIDLEEVDSLDNSEPWGTFLTYQMLWLILLFLVVSTERQVSGKAKTSSQRNFVFAIDKPNPKQSNVKLSKETYKSEANWK